MWGRLKSRFGTKRNIHGGWLSDSLAGYGHFDGGQILGKSGEGGGHFIIDHVRGRK